MDQPGTPAGKRRRLTALGYGIPEWLRLVPADFEAGTSWRDEMTKAGFAPAAPAVVTSTPAAPTACARRPVRTS